MNFKELEKELFDLALFHTSKKASKLSNEDKEKLFNTILNKLCSFNKECVKIAETQVYNILTLSNAKDVIDAFRFNLDLLKALTNKLSLNIEKNESLESDIRNIFKVKKEFETIMSVIENYAFKLNQRVYDIPQDEEINNTICAIMNLFTLIVEVLKEEKQYGSFIMDIERMNKRYNFIYKCHTLSLRKSDVVSK